jgi:hypothetical protein
MELMALSSPSLEKLGAIDTQRFDASSELRDAETDDFK